MDIKAIKETPGAGSIRAYQPDNYSFILKKTEKIVCVVFYITDTPHTSDLNKQKVVSYIQDSARKALECVLYILTDEGTALRQADLNSCVRSFFRLQSVLQIGIASGIVSAEHVDVLSREINDVLRNVNALFSADERTKSLDFDESKTHAHASRDQKLRIGSRERRHGQMAEGTALRRESVRNVSHDDRREAILDVLRSKGQASIKDISDIVSDCSEKTIQRELTTMIKDGNVVRNGERRWSTYRIISQAA